MARCLVTGHKGYIGLHLFNELIKLGHEVIGVDLKEQGDINIIFDTTKKHDKYDDYLNFKPEFIFHMACLPRVSYSVENPVQTTKNNILATTNILNFAKEVKAKRVIFSSSSSVIGDGTGPNSPYALQKLYSEMECKLWSKLYSLDTVSLRYFNVYSEDQKAEDSYATAIANWMYHIRNNLTPFLEGSGEQRRDLVHVNDVVSANIFAMNCKNNFDGLSLDVGTGENISFSDIVGIIKDIFPHINFDMRPTRKGDVLLTKADTKPLKNLGWEAKIKIHYGIKECFIQLQKEMKGV